MTFSVRVPIEASDELMVGISSLLVLEGGTFADSVVICKTEVLDVLEFPLEFGLLMGSSRTGSPGMGPIFFVIVPIKL